MKKKLMAVLLCVCMAAVLLTPYASVLTADGAMRLGFAGADGSLSEDGQAGGTVTDPDSTEGEQVGAPEATTAPEATVEATVTTAPEATVEATVTTAPEATVEATATTAPEATVEATATAVPEETKAEQPAQTEKAPEYTLDSNGAVYKDGERLRGEPENRVVKTGYTAQAYSDPTDRSEAKTYAAGDRVRVYDEIRFDDCDGDEQKWSVVLDGKDFYFVKSEALEAAPAEAEDEQAEESDAKAGPLKVINPGSTAVATYEFYNGTDLVDSQNIKNGEMLKEPATPAADDGQTFDGWYTAAEDGEKFTRFDTALTVTAKETIKLYARFRTVYHIYFYTPDGNTRKFTREVSDHDEHDFSDLSYDVGSNIKVTGWAADIKGTDDISKTIKVPEGQTSVSVYAIETTGYWVVFNTQGGTSVAPVFKAQGDTLALNTVNAPTRTGYKFDGWYENAECTGSAVITVSDAKTLYAKWTAQTANLTVVFWYENADDKYYGQAGSVQTTANTGATVTSDQYKDMSFTGRDGTHFTYNATKNESLIVKGDGTTVLNVYYTRNTYTLTFRAVRNSDWNQSWETVATITAKYDAKISDKFQEAPFTTTYSGRAWKCTDSDKYNYALQTLDRMPGFDATFKLYKKSSDEKKTINYYVQKIGATVDKNTWPSSSENFDLLKRVDTYFNYATYDEEYHEILGFTRYAKDISFNQEYGSWLSTEYNVRNFKDGELDLFYMRNNYKLRFYNHNGELTEKAKDVPYEASLKSYADAVTAPYPFDEPGLYTFEGWYTNGLFEKKVDDTVTMPANDLMLYAKWVPTSYTVKFDLGYEGATDAPTDQTVAAKGKATQPADPERDGFKFLGWYNGEEPFSFETEILEDTTLTAKWFSENTFTVVYDANNGTGTPPADNTQYADGAGATVLGKGELTAPAGKFFLGWATDKDATTAEYLPGGTMTIDAGKANENREITLYAVWGDKPATTTLTYNANYDSANPATKQHALNDSTDLPNNAEVTLYGKDTFTRSGYELIGWNTDKDKATAGEKEYELSATVYVDTINQTTANILYAVWKQSTTTVTVKKVVEGNFGDKNRAFHFTYSWKAGENDTPTTDNFTLTDGAKPFEIPNVPIGATLTITETDTDLTNYTTYFTVNSGAKVKDENRTHSFTVSTGDKVVVTNEYEVVPDTGVMLDSLPYILILAVVALGAAGVVIRRRRSREDD